MAASQAKAIRREIKPTCICSRRQGLSLSCECALTDQRLRACTQVQINSGALLLPPRLVLATSERHAASTQAAHYHRSRMDLRARALSPLIDFGSPPDNDERARRAAAGSAGGSLDLAGVRCRARLSLSLSLSGRLIFRARQRQGCRRAPRQSWTIYHALASPNGLALGRKQSVQTR